MHLLLFSSRFTFYSTIFIPFIFSKPNKYSLASFSAVLLPFVWHALPTVPLPPPFHLLKCPQSSKAISSKEPLWMSPQAVYVHFFLLWSLICTNYLYVYIMTNSSIFAFGIMVPRFYDLFSPRNLRWFSFSYVSWHLSYFSIEKKKSQKLHLLGLLVLSVLWELFMYPVWLELVPSYLVTSHGLQISLDHVCFILFSLKIMILDSKDSIKINVERFCILR